MNEQNTTSEHQNDEITTSNQGEVINRTENHVLTDDESINAGFKESEQYQAENKGFDSMIDDAVKTKEQEASEQRELKEEKPYTPELAAGVAITGLTGAMSVVNKFTDKPIEVSQETTMVFAAMCTPLVMKYGKTIKSLLNPENVDLNSNVPEWLAVAALGVVAVPSYLQVKQHQKQKALEQLSQDKKEQKPATENEQVE